MNTTEKHKAEKIIKSRILKASKSRSKAQRLEEKRVKDEVEVNLGIDLLREEVRQAEFIMEQAKEKLQKLGASGYSTKGGSYRWNTRTGSYDYDEEKETVYRDEVNALVYETFPIVDYGELEEELITELWFTEDLQEVKALLERII